MDASIRSEQSLLVIFADLTRYSAQALWPSVDCDTNTDCDPTNFPTPSGINNLFDQGCHTEPWAAALSTKAGECFFNKEFPSLGGFQH